MLEKIGLPPKPSLRTNNWVLDASHCQSCSSQFTFLNRKHHCRRCGGIFCNACTHHRMVLRGQGDSPVRICDSCKSLEEAARFELRYGHKNRASKGSSKGGASNVDEVLNQILANDRKKNGKDTASQDEDADLLRTDNSDESGVGTSEMDSLTPDELRQQAVDEKNKYKVLKGEGKSADALKAFKRAKELERQAAALDLQIRKSRRKALTSSSTAEVQRKEDMSPENGTKDRSIPQKSKEKDDLTAELRELGWSDFDGHDSDKKPASMSLEGELLNLIGHESGKTSHSKASSGTNKSQVIALKKKALALKREGKLAEAKEELKKAKILEKQIEEQEFLAEAEDSDDELSALIRSLDNDDPKGFSVGFDLDAGLDLTNLSALGGDLGFDGNFEVTDDDLHDPDMAAALQSLGWDEEDIQHDSILSQSASVDRETHEAEIVKLKKEAVNQKRSGHMAEAVSLLKKAKNLEKDLEKLDNMAAPDATDYQSAPKASEIGEHDSRTSKSSIKDRKAAPKSRFTIQKELLALKKKALALRREGKLEEADDELKKGKVLEQQLEEMDSAGKVSTQMDDSYAVSESMISHLDLPSVLAPADEEGDLTDQDLHDPAYLSVLQNLGWQDEDTVMSSAEVSNQASVVSKDTPSARVTAVKRQRSKAEIQRELLALKRKAFALRRQGQETEAEEVLEGAKVLEEELAESEAPKQVLLTDLAETKVEVEAKKQEIVPEIIDSTEKGNYQTPLKRLAEVSDASEKRQVLHVAAPDPDLLPSVSPENQRSPLQQEILAHKRKAVALKREGKLAEARDELRKAKLLERKLEEDKPDDSAGVMPMEVTYSTVSSTVRSEHSPSTKTNSSEKDPLPAKPMKDRDRFKLQRECLAHKRNALKLRREGRDEEADAELELAKKLEAQLEVDTPQNSKPPNSVEESADDAGEDLFDPQLLSALKSIGLHDALVVSHAPVKPEVSAPTPSKNDTSSQERLQLEAQIKAEKMTALNLKRAGKQTEALNALRHAKQMEKKLNSLPS